MTKESIGAVDTDKETPATNNKESESHSIVVSSTNKNHDDEDASEKEQVGRFSQSTKRSSLSGKQARFLTPKAKSWKAGKTHESSADFSTDAVLVQPRRTPTEIHQNGNQPTEDTSPVWIVTAQPVDEENASHETKHEDWQGFESKIQQEVKSRLLMQQEKVIVAEPLDATEVMGDGNENGEGRTRKWFGIQREKVLFVALVMFMLALVAVVLGVVLPSKHGTLPYTLY